jgi:uncharacterized membrane protein
MAGLALGRRAERARSWGPDAYERLLAGGAVALLAAVAAALARGRAHWAAVPGVVWAHLLTVLVALALTPVLLLRRRRGDARHRWLGRVWVAAMLATALLSFGVRLSRPGQFSIIHLLSIYVVAMAPVIGWSAATHRVDLHRGAVRGMVTGSLLIAGFFTFPFGRMLGHWLFA